MATRLQMIKRMRERMTESVIADAIRDALEHSDCLPKYRAAVVALLQRDLPIRVEPIDGNPNDLQIFIEGGGDISQAVGMWLASDQGRDFCAPPMLPGSGMFAAMMMNGRLH